MVIEIKRVLIRKDGIKMVVIPKHSKINANELVLITNNITLINKFKKEDIKNGWS